jgi:small-conductance mechanosensitive channel
MPDFSDMSISEVASEVHNLLTTTLFTLKETPVTLMSIVIFLIFITGFIFAGGFIKRILQSRVLPRFDIEQGLRYTLARVTQYFIITIGFLISFQFIGIDLSSLAVIFGLLSVGIGFGLQNITSNFISGLIVLFERPISVGDRVSVGGVEGDVIEINIRATKIRTLNNIFIIVPNSEFVSSNVVNYSHGDTSYRLDLNVGVSYSSDLDLVLKALREVMDENPKIMKNPEAQIHLVEFGDSSWNMQIRAWIPYVKDYPVIRDNINQAIVRKFREYDIEIPFPQRDLHVRSSIPIPYKKDENGNEEKSE